MAVTVKIDDHEYTPARITVGMLKSLWDLDEEGVLEHVELLDGVLIEMPPAKRRHGMALLLIGRAILNAIPPDLAALADGMIFLGDRTMLAPDLLVLRKGVEFEDATPKDVRLAIEISDATLARDLGEKARLYAAHRVREMWVVDLPNATLHIHRDPGDMGYASVDALDWGVAASPLYAPDQSFLLAEILRDL